MNSQNQAQQSNFSSDEINALIIESIQDIKGKNLLKLDLRQLDDAPASFFIICEGDSSTQVKAISDNIYKRLKTKQEICLFTMKVSKTLCGFVWITLTQSFMSSIRIQENITN